jgi:hypothetical protein
MQSLDTIHDYLRSHSEEIGARILSSYPALHGADDAPFSAGFSNGARSISGPIPGDYGREQALAVGA